MGIQYVSAYNGVRNQTCDGIQYVRACNDDDPLFLQNSDHPGMTLVTTALTGNNCLSWRSPIKLALGEKVKLGSFNGKSEIPSEIHPTMRNGLVLIVGWHPRS